MTWNYGMDRLDKSILMELQYRFPETPTPYCDVAERLGLRTGDVLGRLRRLYETGVLKRVGFYVNYRSRRLKAALIAIAAGSRIYEIVESYFSRDPLTTHVYERNHPIYNLWVVSKRHSREQLNELARVIENEHGVDVLVLHGERTYKLSVKYDLYRGVSRSGPYSYIAMDAPSPQHYGLTHSQLGLFKRLPFTEHPYRQIASKLNLNEKGVVELAWRMLQDGVLGDPGAALDGHKIGFRVNAMLAVKPNDDTSTCECLARQPYTTHVVQRSVYPLGKWDYTCYAMIHTISRKLAYEVFRHVTRECEVRDYTVLESLRDLKPGHVR